MPRLLSITWFCVLQLAVTQANGPAPDPLKQQIVKTYSAIAHAAYQDSITSARALQTAIESFLAQPTEDNLQKARASWTASRVPYLQTEVYRFTEGPIEAVEGLINAWPLDEHYIDYVEGEPDAGIINNPAQFPKITAALVRELNEKEGEKNICAGFHAIEFLLWGQDFDTHGPGKRPATDFALNSGNQRVQRRRDYLKAATSLLLQTLAEVEADWAEKPGNYRERLSKMPPDEALAVILRGMGSLSGAEISGERLTVPYETKEQEDEHSCFSDTTLQDHLYDLIGVQNLFLGRYKRIDGTTIQGPGLRDLLLRENEPLAKTLEKQIETSIEAVKAIPHPFDQAMLGRDDAPGRKAMQRAIKAVTAQTDSLSKAAEALGLKLNL